MDKGLLLSPEMRSNTGMTKRSGDVYLRFAQVPALNKNFGLLADVASKKLFLKMWVVPHNFL